jgi:integrase/recombinase XerD
VFLAADLPDGHPHQLRDTAAVEWLKAGIPLEEVSKLLGHASIRTTEKHYSPWVKSRQDRLDDLVMGTWKGQRAERPGSLRLPGNPWGASRSVNRS